MCIYSFSLFMFASTVPHVEASEWCDVTQLTDIRQPASLELSVKRGMVKHLNKGITRTTCK